MFMLDSFFLSYKIPHQSLSTSGKGKLYVYIVHIIFDQISHRYLGRA